MLLFVCLAHNIYIFIFYRDTKERLRSIYTVVRNQRVEKKNYLMMQLPQHECELLMIPSASQLVVQSSIQVVSYLGRQLVSSSGKWVVCYSGSLLVAQLGSQLIGQTACQLVSVYFNVSSQSYFRQASLCDGTEGDDFSTRPGLVFTKRLKPKSCSQ